jgi:hypothetical protein
MEGRGCSDGAREEAGEATALLLEWIGLVSACIFTRRRRCRAGRRCLAASLLPCAGVAVAVRRNHCRALEVSAVRWRLCRAPAQAKNFFIFQITSIVLICNVIFFNFRSLL